MDNLQWGSRKRLRCLKVKDSNLIEKSDPVGGVGTLVKKKINSLADEDKESKPPQSLTPLRRVMETNGLSGNEKKSTAAASLDKEERYYATRAVGLEDHGSRIFMDSRDEKAAIVWPKLIVTLSSKEKEEDFMAMKGCKLPQRPKKRAKLIQKTLLLVSPGAWLSDLCKERYEVREKRTPKKKPRGLKAMGSMESDSE